MCTLCQTPCYQENQLKIHVKTHHPQFVRRHWFPCRGCRDYFPSSIDLACHKCDVPPVQSQTHDVHQRPFVSRRNNNKFCHICGCLVPNAQWYHSHMHEVHFNYVKAHWWLCNFCGIYLPFQEALFIHQSQVHGWTNQVIAQQPHLQNLPPPAAPSLNQTIRPDLHSQKTIQSQPIVHLPEESTIQSKDLDEEPGELVIDTDRFSSTSPRPSSPTEDTVSSVGDSGKKCRLCGLFINGKKQTGYNNHFRKYHLDYVKEHWLSCQHCDKYFPSKNTLKAVS